MQVWIEDLFLITHQRGMGRTKSIGLSFARGHLAEKRRLPVNWAEFAVKQTNRRRSPDSTFVPQGLTSRGRHDHHRYWVFDEESKTVKFDYEGAPDDSDLNPTAVMQSIILEVLNSDYSPLLRGYTAEFIGHPICKRCVPWQETTTDCNGSIASQGIYIAHPEVSGGRRPTCINTHVLLDGGVARQDSRSLPSWKDVDHELLLSPYNDAVQATGTRVSMEADCLHRRWKRKTIDSHPEGPRIRRED
ncbi:hypothetical protein M758_UG318000 [Ceratodon purpureus]|nr:hypothetical protein M758_UG318000 [Ceratodon purpureus]